MILQRTVFVSTGPDTVRFIHWSWQEFLLARYFLSAYLGVVLTIRPAQGRYFVTTPDTPPLTSAATCPSANGVARPPGEAR